MPSSAYQTTSVALTPSCSLLQLVTLLVLQNTNSLTVTRVRKGILMYESVTAWTDKSKEIRTVPQCFKAPTRQNQCDWRPPPRWSESPQRLLFLYWSPPTSLKLYMCIVHCAPPMNNLLEKVFWHCWQWWSWFWWLPHSTYLYLDFQLCSMTKLKQHCSEFCSDGGSTALCYTQPV